MADNQDISKIIGIIMENPDIIARIKSLADSNSSESEDISTEVSVPAAQSEKRDELKQTASATYVKSQSKKRRRELLSALKPYVKSERAKAIDTMLSVIDVIDVMKER